MCLNTWSPADGAVWEVSELLKVRVSLAEVEQGVVAFDGHTLVQCFQSISYYPFFCVMCAKM